MEDFKIIMDQLNQTLKRVQVEQAELANKLTSEQRLMVAPIQSDITAALEALKQGDLTALTNLQLKYGNPNSK